MTEELYLTTLLPVTVENLYNAWLDNREHAAFTGAGAVIDAVVGGKFSAWDGYITGTTLEMKPYQYIRQTWRTTDFEESDADSILEIIINPEDGQSRLILKHTNIPDGQGESYRQGWEDYYFKPMLEYFQKETPAI